MEGCAEDEFGRWAADEVTGEHGYVDDERSCFWTWDDTEGLAVQTTQGPPVEKKEKEKESPRVYTKESEEHSLAKNEHKILNCGQKMI